MEKVFKVGLIGCGHIAETYFRAHKYFKNFKIVKCADKINSVAKYCAKTYSIENVSVSEILKDKDIQVILNLTTPNSHYIIAKKSLLNGKHVYSEKPLAVSYNNGKELVNIARRKKLYLGNAPDTFLGGGNQKAREILEKQIIGKIKFGTAVFAFPGIQSYHPNPEPWFAKKGGGPVIDMGPYYLTALVNLLGPAKDVISISSKDNKKRIIGVGPKKGKKIKVNCPTTYFSTINFKNGAIIRLTLSFDVVSHLRNHIELYGEKGSMIVPDPNMFGGSVMTCTDDNGLWEEHKTDELPLGKINITSHSGRANESPTNANYRGVGLAEMAYGIEHGLKHRCSGELSLHVLDIIKSTMKAADTQTPQDINTTCQKADFFTLEEIQKILKQ